VILLTTTTRRYSKQQQQRTLFKNDRPRFIMILLFKFLSDLRQLGTLNSSNADFGDYTFFIRQRVVKFSVAYHENIIL